MVIRLNIAPLGAVGGRPVEPDHRQALVVVINGRERVPRVSYGGNGTNPLRPDLEVSLSAETLHQILTGELRLSKALGQGVMRVRGNVLKGKVLEDLFHQGQAIYPQILFEWERGD
jgi:hypothetical protein